MSERVLEWRNRTWAETECGIWPNEGYGIEPKGYYGLRPRAPAGYGIRPNTLISGRTSLEYFGIRPNFLHYIRPNSNVCIWSLGLIPKYLVLFPMLHFPLFKISSWLGCHSYTFCLLHALPIHTSALLSQYCWKASLLFELFFSSTFSAFMKLFSNFSHLNDFSHVSPVLFPIKVLQFW